MSTKIEWCDETWNPVTGCTKVSEGCANCYAEGIAKRFWRERKFSDVKCHIDRLDKPLHWKKPRKVFVCSMGDLFHDDVPFEFIVKVFDIIEQCPEHTFMILTKRPENMLKFIIKWKNYFIETDRMCYCEGLNQWTMFYPNAFLGVSVENQHTADVRVPFLIKMPPAIKFVSCEPLLGSLDLGRIIRHKNIHEQSTYSYASYIEHLNWVICGGETGLRARPMDLKWARRLRDQCEGYDVPFFFKKTGDGSETPDDLMIRNFPSETN